MHHAYLLVADKERGIAHAREMFELPEDAHPDVLIISYALLGIDEARMLKEWAFQRPVMAEKRHFIIACDDILHESQNALLKLFEEPPQTSVFSLVMPREDRVLATLRSRLEVIRLEALESDKAATAFLKLDLAARLEEVGKRTKAKDLAWQRDLLAGLERILHARGDHAALRTLTSVESKIGARGASPKMLLEHLALALPQA
jgi:DNA polymerase III delta prime subunit